MKKRTGSGLTPCLQAKRSESPAPNRCLFTGSSRDFQTLFPKKRARTLATPLRLSKPNSRIFPVARSGDIPVADLKRCGAAHSVEWRDGVWQHRYMIWRFANRGRRQECRRSLASPPSAWTHFQSQLVRPRQRDCPTGISPLHCVVTACFASPCFCRAPSIFC